MLSYHAGNVEIVVKKVKVKRSHYRPGVAQRVGTGIAQLFHDRGARKGWEVSSMPQPYFTHGKHPVPILQEAGWAPGPVWTGGKSRPCWDSILDHPTHSQLLYQLSYPAHRNSCSNNNYWITEAVCKLIDRLYGLVVRVSGYRYRGPGFDPRRYQIFWVVVGLEWGPLSLVR